MENQEIRIDNSLTVAGITLVPVVQITLSYWHGDSGISYFGAKRPIGVVVVSPSAKKAFRITGEEVPLDQFIREVPNMEGRLAEI